MLNFSSDRISDKSKEVVAKWRDKNPSELDRKLAETFVFKSLAPTTLKTYQTAASMYLLLHGPASFPIDKFKLITFIRLRSDLGSNPRTIKNYVYSIISLNLHMGHPTLNSDDKRAVDKALVTASKESPHVPITRADVVSFNCITKLMNLKVPCEIRILTLLGLSFALRMGEIVKISPAMISCSVINGQFCLSLVLPNRKNSNIPVTFELFCRAKNHCSTDPCKLFGCCPAHLVFHLAQNRDSIAPLAGTTSDKFISVLRARFFESGCRSDEVSGVTGHTIRRSALQKLFLDEVPDVYIHSVAGWAYSKSSNMVTYLDSVLKKIKRHNARLWFGDLTFNEVLELEDCSSTQLRF
jgi:hypothetical protein